MLHGFLHLALCFGVHLELHALLALAGSRRMGAGTCPAKPYCSNAHNSSHSNRSIHRTIDLSLVN